ncbi:flagellin [Natrinema sp. SYSU A 869]|uniref:DUF7289 family protein n=1 Tax=Natrinema sp. SYSU A 869 TaxID=2871694 RepID=UPI001CA44741|nr:flagellin [Natrinema sp. SYSU A 869]
MFDAIETEVNNEQTQQFVSETDHRITTAAVTGEDQPLPIDEMQGGEPTITDDGNISVRWFNATDGTRCSPVKGELRALEFELDGRTIAHQGGGVWEQTNGQTSIVSEPQIGYDGDRLQLQVLQLEEGDFGGSDPMARANHSESTNLTDRINNAAEGCSTGTDVSFRIEDSTYHEGWNQFLSDAVNEDKYSNVGIEHKSSEETVEVNITGIREPVETTTVVVAEDRGLSGPGANELEYEQRLNRSLGGGPNNAIFGIEAKIENTGDEDETQTVTASIWDEELDTNLLETNKEVTISPGDPEELAANDLKFQHSEYKDELSHGETYKYIIATEDDRADDPPGSFYFGNSGSEFNVTEDDIETMPTGDGNVTITAEIQNHGIEEGNQNVTIDFDEHDVTANETVSLDYGATGTVSWTVNKSALPYGSNEFEIRTDDDEATGTVIGEATGDEGAFIVVEDEGVGGDQIVVTGEPFTVDGEVASTYASDGETREVRVTIPEAGVDRTEPITLDSGEHDTVSFDINPADYDFESGTVYDYDIVADGEGLSEQGSFYVGEPGTNFELSNGNATVDDDTVTITTDLENTGVDSGSQTASLNLEYLDEMPDDLEGENPYGDLFEREVTRSFGESDTIELELNESKLLDGEYRATIRTDDGTETIDFVVDTGIDPGRVGLGEIDDANVTVDVVGSQVSGNNRRWNYWEDKWEYVHLLAPMTLDVVANGGTEHSFDNPTDGDNINTGPTWQDKTGDSYTYNFTVEDETELTLRNTRYSLCNDRSTDPDELSHYSDPEDRALEWCNDVSSNTEFGPIDASQGENLQNVRVRSAENNTIPALPAGADQQISATEALEERGLVKDEDELNLDSGEFVFLFENTAECGRGCDEDDIDALWDDAVEAYERNPHRTNDPDFNDLIVYVEVERAGVDPGTPSITIIPGGGNSTDVDAGDGRDAGGVEDVDPTLEGDTDEGSSPSVGTGESNTDETDGVTGDTGVDVDADNIVIG